MADAPRVITAEEFDAMSPDERARVVREHIVTDLDNLPAASAYELGPLPADWPSSVAEPPRSESGRQVRVAPSFFDQLDELPPLGDLIAEQIPATTPIRTEAPMPRAASGE